MLCKNGNSISKFTINLKHIYSNKSSAKIKGRFFCPLSSMKCPLGFFKKISKIWKNFFGSLMRQNNTIRFINEPKKILEKFFLNNELKK